MPVMAASMHDAVGLRAVGEPVCLADWQRVHVGAQPDAAGPVPALEHTYHASAADAAVNLQPEALQEIRDAR